MMRLNVENLEGRALMSANVVAVAAPVGAETATIRVVESSNPTAGHVSSSMELEWTFISSFTPPIGSNRGSFCGDGIEAENRPWGCD